MKNVLALLAICGATQSFAAAHHEEPNEYRFGATGMLDFITARTILQGMNIAIIGQPNDEHRFTLGNTAHLTSLAIQEILNNTEYLAWRPEVSWLRTFDHNLFVIFRPINAFADDHEIAPL